MNFTEFTGIIVIGIGTYLLRYLPLKASILRSNGKDNKKDITTNIFEIAGISIVASLFVSSIDIPQICENFPYFLNVCISSVIVILICSKWKNPGLSVIVGIISFAILGFIL